jgi:molecular chaperone GrpE
MVNDNEGTRVRIEVNADPERNPGEDSRDLQTHAPSQPVRVEDRAAPNEAESTEGATDEEVLAGLRKYLEARRSTMEGADEILRLLDEDEGDSGPGVSLAAGLAGAFMRAADRAAENRDRWVRAVADLENFKKRATTERGRLLKYQYEDLLRDLLPIIDNMERALDHAREENQTGPFVEGVEMIVGMLREVMGRHGAVEIDAVGEPFDPNLHEAVSRVPGSGMEPNTVVHELEKGYLYKDRLLRPAKVTVAHD